MIYPELRSILGDLEPPSLPEDPGDCAVAFRLLIGPRDEPGAEAFAFLVATPAALRRAVADAPVWGRGYLVVAEFDWGVVVRAIAELLATCARPTWEEVVADLSKELRWKPDHGAPGT